MKEERKKIEKKKLRIEVHKTKKLSPFFSKVFFQVSFVKYFSQKLNYRKLHQLKLAAFRNPSGDPVRKNYFLF